MSQYLGDRLEHSISVYGDNAVSKYSRRSSVGSAVVRCLKVTSQNDYQKVIPDGNRPTSSGGEDFGEVLPYIGLAAILVM